MKCERCGSIQQKTITVICEQNWPNLRSAPTPKNKGTCLAIDSVRLVWIFICSYPITTYFSLQCHACGQTRGVMVVDSTTHPLTDEYSINGILVPLMQIECVGYTPVECILWLI